MRWKLAVGRLWALGGDIQDTASRPLDASAFPAGSQDSPEVLVPEPEAPSEPSEGTGKPLSTTSPTFGACPCVQASLRLALPLSVPRDKCCLMTGFQGTMMVKVGRVAKSAILSMRNGCQTGV